MAMKVHRVEVFYQDETGMVQSSVQEIAGGAGGDPYVVAADIFRLGFTRERVRDQGERTELTHYGPQAIVGVRWTR